MKKTTYIALSGLTALLLVYTGYFTITQPPKAATATTTPMLTEEVVDKNTLTTKNGKSITVRETNPSGQSLSTITLIPLGFENNTEIVLEKNKLSTFFLVDINRDSFEEFAIITTSQGSGSYGELTLFTTANNKQLTPVLIPSMSEEDTKKGALFEGYLGHDTFSIIDGKLIREFPIYNASDTNSLPTGPSKKILYSLSVATSGVWSVNLEAELQIISSTSTKATSTLTVASSTKSTATSTRP